MIKPKPCEACQLEQMNLKVKIVQPHTCGKSTDRTTLFSKDRVLGPKLNRDQNREE